MKMNLKKSMPVVGMLLLVILVPFTLFVVDHTRRVQGLNPYEGAGGAEYWQSSENWQKIDFWQTYRRYVQSVFGIGLIVSFFLGVISVFVNKGVWKIMGIINIFATIVVFLLSIPRT